MTVKVEEKLLVSLPVGSRDKLRELAVQHGYMALGGMQAQLGMGSIGQLIAAIARGDLEVARRV
jgi:hypothetical protein